VSRFAEHCGQSAIDTRATATRIVAVANSIVLGLHMDNQNRDRLFKFIKRKLALNDSLTLTSKTRLVEDLKLLGDDADEFMGDWAEEFSIEAGDFRLDSYFPTEGLNLIGAVLAPFRKKIEAVTLTIEMLEKAMDLGVWDSKKIENRTD
jgi:Protein of unknown function (DUF1493)